LIRSSRSPGNLPWLLGYGTWSQRIDNARVFPSEFCREGPKAKFSLFYSLLYAPSRRPVQRDCIRHNQSMRTAVVSVC
jgi:hypothetical protein